MLLTAGKLPDLTGGEVAHANAFKAFNSLFAVARPPETKQPDRAIKPHQDDIDNACGEIPVNTGALRHIGHPVACLVKRFAENAYFARQPWDHAKCPFQEGRFARPVRPDNRGHGARRDRGIDGKDRRFIAIGYRKATHRQRRILARDINDLSGFCNQFCVAHDSSFGGAAQEPAASLPCIPVAGASPPSARVIRVALWSIMPI